MLPTVQPATSDMLPSASAERKYTVPLSVNVIASVYACHVVPSNEYSFVSALALKVALTTTSPLVGSVVLTETTGVEGAVTIFSNAMELIPTFPAASVALK